MNTYVKLHPVEKIINDFIELTHSSTQKPFSAYATVGY